MTQLNSVALHDPLAARNSKVRTRIAHRTGLFAQALSGEASIAFLDFKSVCSLLFLRPSSSVLHPPPSFILLLPSSSSFSSSIILFLLLSPLHLLQACPVVMWQCHVTLSVVHQTLHLQHSRKENVSRPTYRDPVDNLLPGSPACREICTST